MSADLDSILTAVSSTAVGGAAVLLIAKSAISKFFQERDDQARLLRDIDKTQAVLISRIDTLEKDINAIAGMIRRNTPP